MSQAKSILIALVAVILIIAGLVFLKLGQFNVLANSGDAFMPPPSAVSTYTVSEQTWPSVYKAVATVEASEGIVVAAELQGKVKRIGFKSGQRVKEGDILIEQESGNERAQLDAAKARLKLAQSSYARLQQLLNQKLVSQSDVDNGLQQLESAQGDVNNFAVSLEKKMVRAPFDGVVGIRQVDLGQDLLVGAPIVSLQASNSVKVNIPVPQSWMVKMRKGLPVRILPQENGAKFLESEIMALGADINIQTRSAMVQTLLNNSAKSLIPGMAVNVEVDLGDAKPMLAIPATTIIYATYGDTVFVVDKDEATGKLTARQQFVQLGKSRGDFVEIEKGLSVGEQVISAGGFKLFNGAPIVINNESTTQPYSTEPTPPNT